MNFLFQNYKTTSIKAIWNTNMKQEHGLSYGEATDILFSWNHCHSRVEHGFWFYALDLCSKDMVFLMVMQQIFFSREIFLTVLHGAAKVPLALMNSLLWGWNIIFDFLREGKRQKPFGILWNLTLCLWRAVLCFVLKLHSVQLILSWWSIKYI